MKLEDETLVPLGEDGKAMIVDAKGESESTKQLEDKRKDKKKDKRAAKQLELMNKLNKGKKSGHKKEELETNMTEQVIPGQKAGKSEPVPDTEEYHYLKLLQGEVHDPDSIPEVVGEDGYIPTMTQIFLEDAEDREDRFRVDEEEKIPFFARQPKDFPLYNDHRPLTHKYNWYPVRPLLVTISGRSIITTTKTGSGTTT